jgi:cysteine-rich repeat protein
MMGRRGAALALALAAGLALAGLAAAAVSRPGEAGHALLFSDNYAKVEPFDDMPSDELTFEAWLSTTDYCHPGTVMSYSVKPKPGAGKHERTRDYNNFVIWDLNNIVACHDFEYLTVDPDPNKISCRAQFVDDTTSGQTASFVDRTGEWHHLAVTFNARENGRIRIYKDGLKVAESETGRTAPIPPGGAFLLGAEQDCYGGCTDAHQAFYGYMDEVRLWRTERSQADISKYMRDASTFTAGHSDLVAYWKFDDPSGDSGVLQRHMTAVDSTGNGHTLKLVEFPEHQRADIKRAKKPDADSMYFSNNFLTNPGVIGFPEGDITVAFWARVPAEADGEEMSEFLSYATVARGDADPNNDNGRADTLFMDDAFLIERYLTEFEGSGYIDDKTFQTKGAVSVHINANRQGNGAASDNWIDFDTQWLDDQWHHVAVTWHKKSGEVHLYFDGKDRAAFWASDRGTVYNRSPKKGGVKKNTAAGTHRAGDGSLVLGQKQECYGGCFSPGKALDGQLAQVRIWDRALSGRDVEKYSREWRPLEQVSRAEVPVLEYLFADAPTRVARNTGKSQNSLASNDLQLSGSSPFWEYSTAPLMNPTTGKPVEGPKAGSAGYAFRLDDQQVLMVSDFKNFPSSAITVEFWMWSTDTCREGVPFSYATGGYEKSDNSFLIFNYNDWGVSVMEDEGTMADHTAGIASTDGDWHHIAVTWESSTGRTVLYDNGRPVWVVSRGKGKTIPSGGTLVIGREQDCMGGCFDSARGAAGNVDDVTSQEYGPQDFFGVVEEMRVWNRALSQQEIVRNMLADDGSTATGSDFENPGVDPKSPGLVSYWRFNEGPGSYIVKDEAVGGNDLEASYEPKWEVVQWLSRCGDGLVEGEEECDTGMPAGGTGCDKDCKVESGWVCTATNPSSCQRSNSPSGGGGGGSGVGGGGGGPTPDHHRGHGGDPYAPPSNNHSKKNHGGGAVVGILLSLVLVGVLAAGYVWREKVFDMFPGVKRAVDGARHKLSQPRNRAYNMLAIDAEDTLAPDFVGMHPPRDRGAYRPPTPDTSALADPLNPQGGNLPASDGTPPAS